MSLIRTDITDHAAWVTLDHAPLNILNGEMLSELANVLEELAGNTEVSTIVLGAVAGSKAFSAGVEISEHTPDKVEGMLIGFHRVIKLLLEQPQVTVAAVDGHALGGGLELAMACDIVVASSNAKFGLPEIKLACFPPAALAMLTSLCGRAVASDMVLTGDNFSAKEARRFGLVSRLFEPEAFTQGLKDMLSGMTQHSPAVLAMTRKILRQQYLGNTGLGIAPRLDAIEKVYLTELTQEKDMEEGITAFMEKRNPVWGNSNP